MGTKGYSELRCGADGSWDGLRTMADDRLVLPACIGKVCKALAPPGLYTYVDPADPRLRLQTGSVATSNGGRYPSEASYSCSPGYQVRET